MSLIFKGSERDTIIINNNVYKFEYVWGQINMDGANAQNAKYRGSNLGAFTEDYAALIHGGGFGSMQVGDTFIQNGHTYKIAGFNYLCGADNNPELGNHLIMITDDMGTYPMNNENTTSGGFVATDMWKTRFPQIVKQLQADFGDHLLTWNEYLTNSNDIDTAAANGGQYYQVQASMMNTAMYWGSPGQYSTPANGKNYNIGIETKELPIMQLHPDEQKNGGNSVWQRDICDGHCFAIAGYEGGQNKYPVYDDQGVRAFFLID